MENINHKALCAFRKFGAVALITATIALFFTACNQTGNTGGGGKPTPKPKHAITFSVDSTTPNGKLKAKADGVPETATSPISVEEGKTVTFTAEPSANYKVKEWKVDDKPVTEAGTNTEYKLKVSKAVSVKVSFELPSVEGGAVLILSPNKLTIKVRAKTEDGSAITVEGCNETTLKSDMTNITELHATGTKVVLKGKITDLNVSGTYNNKQPLTAIDVSGLTSLWRLDCSENKLTELDVQGCTALKYLYCSSNKLTELNVQGLTALQVLSCSSNQLTELNVQGLTALQMVWCYENQLSAIDVHGLNSLQDLNYSYNQLTELNVEGCTSLKTLTCDCNKINAEAMTKLLNALPAREAGDDAYAVLYTEYTGEPEGNCKDFTQPAELKTAFDGAKSRNWKLQKVNASRKWEDI